MFLFNHEVSETLIKLRGHHLICLHFFSGEGYDSKFIENFKNVMRIAKSKEIEVCRIADDICQKCPYLKDEKCQFSEYADKEVNEMDDKAMHLLKLAPGMMVKWYLIKNKLLGIFQEWYEFYCVDCEWRWACEKKVFYRHLKNKIQS